MKIVIALAVAVFILGCAQFEAPFSGVQTPLSRTPDIESAVIATHSSSARLGRINGLSYVLGPGEIGVQLSPGTHNIQLLLPDNVNLGENATVIASAQSDQRVQLRAGHTYVPRARVENWRVVLWLQDMGKGVSQSCLREGVDCTAESGAEWTLR